MTTTCTIDIGVLACRDTDIPLKDRALMLSRVTSTKCLKRERIYYSNRLADEQRQLVRAASVDTLGGGGGGGGDDVAVVTSSQMVRLAGNVERFNAIVDLIDCALQVRDTWKIVSGLLLNKNKGQVMDGIDLDYVRSSDDEGDDDDEGEEEKEQEKEEAKV